MRALKTIVFVLGLLVVGAFGLLVYGLSQNWHRLSTPPAAAPAPATAPAAGKTGAAVAAWGHVGLGQPADTRIQSVTTAGNLVVVQVTSGGGERLLVLDPATGTLVGTFGVTDKP